MVVRGVMDWFKYLRDQAVRTPIITVAEAAKVSQLEPVSTRRALARLQVRGFVEKIANGVYLNSLVTQFSATDIVNILRPNSYVSLDSALLHWGISTQSSNILTCVTTGKPKEYISQELRIRFRTLAPKLYWGFTERPTRYGTYNLAEPEKALLDWVYLSLQDGGDPALDELSFRTLDRRKLVGYASKYPSSVLKCLLPALAVADSDTRIA